MYGLDVETVDTGRSGLRSKIRKIRQLVEKAKLNPNFRAQTLSLIRHVPEKDVAGEIRAITEYVKDSVRYVRDPWSKGGLELFHEAEVLLAGSMDGTAQGDCDDHVILASAMLETIGVPTRYRVGGAPPDHYKHIWLEALNPKTRQWLPLELTQKNLPYGYDPSSRFDLVETHLGGLGADEGENMVDTIPVSGGNVSRLVSSIESEPLFQGALPSDFMRELALSRDPNAVHSGNVDRVPMRRRRPRRTYVLNAQPRATDEIEWVPQTVSGWNGGDDLDDYELAGFSLKKAFKRVTKQFKRSLPDAASAAGMMFGGPMGAQMGGRLASSLTGREGSMQKYLGMFTSLMGGFGGFGGAPAGAMPISEMIPGFLGQRMPMPGGMPGMVGIAREQQAPSWLQSLLSGRARDIFAPFGQAGPPVPPGLPPGAVGDVSSYFRSAQSRLKNFLSPFNRGQPAPIQNRMLPPVDPFASPWSLFGDDDTGLGQFPSEEFDRWIAIERSQGAGWKRRVAKRYGRFLRAMLEAKYVPTHEIEAFFRVRIPGDIKSKYPRGAKWAVNDWGAGFWTSSLWEAAASIHAGYLVNPPSGPWTHADRKPTRSVRHRYTHTQLKAALARELSLVASKAGPPPPKGKRKPGPKLPTTGVLASVAVGLGILWLARRGR